MTTNVLFGVLVFIVSVFVIGLIIGTIVFFIELLLDKIDDGFVLKQPHESYLRLYINILYGVLTIVGSVGVVAGLIFAGIALNIN